jgi:Ca-activated chloride channel family protein
VLGYDLVISPSADETVPTAPVALYVGQIPADVAKLVKIETGFVKVVDWQRNSPLLQHVQLTEVQMSDNPISQADVQDRDYENQGYEILAHASKGPLILHKNRDGKQSLWLLFHPDRSTLPYRVAFPILVSNLIQVAMHQAGLSEIHGQSTGALPARVAEPRSSYSIIGPTGMRQDLNSSDEGLLTGISAPQVGRYDIQKGLSTVAKTGASLLSPAETSLKSIDTIQFREVSVKATETKLTTDRPLWTQFAILGLVFLAIEWWFFQRRPGGW